MTIHEHDDDVAAQARTRDSLVTQTPRPDPRLCTPASEPSWASGIHTSDSPLSLALLAPIGTVHAVPPRTTSRSS